MDKLNFLELVIIAQSLDVNFDALIPASELACVDTKSSKFLFSERNWDTLHTLLLVLNEIYKQRPLLF